jgi:FdhD protein
MSEDTINYTILKAQGSVVQTTKDIIIREIPLTIFFNNEEIVTVLCSPSQIEELSIGFLLTKGFIRKQEDLFSLKYEPENNLIWIEGQTNDASLIKPLTSTVKISLEEAYKYSEYLSTHSPLFQATGGVHGGGIAWRGDVLLSSYDIGRHNVFDKLFGQAFKTGLDLTDHVIFFSGRISSEILLKAAKMNIPVVMAKSAPTDLALNLANELGITVLGFARQNRLNIYTHPQRIIIPDSIPER